MVLQVWRSPSAAGATRPLHAVAVRAVTAVTAGGTRSSSPCEATLRSLLPWRCRGSRARERRCKHNKEWTRQQPGLSTIRELFCEEQKKLAGPKGTTDPVCAASKLGRKEAHRENGRIAFHARRNGSLRSATVFKILFLLLSVGFCVGWKLRQRIGKTAGRQAEPSCEPYPFEGIEGRATSTARYQLHWPLHWP